MTLHVDELLPALLLGDLSAEAAAEVELHLGGCSRCAAERAALADTLGELALGLPPEPDDGSGRRALLTAARAATAHGGRFFDYRLPVASLLDLPVDQAEVLLDRIDAIDTAWLPLGLPGSEGISYLTPPKGPRLGQALVTMLRLSPGARYPEHAHHGPEQVLLLQGGFFDETAGKEFGAGALCTMAAGSSHSFRAVAGPDCICLGVVEVGIRLLDGGA